MTPTRHRLLLVEDNEQLGTQVVAALTGAGYETDWIRDGSDALAAKFDRYSLVILDLMLPGASGFDILARIRGEGVRTPVLIASARNDAADKLRAADLGATDYMTKPFWPQELLVRVAAHLAPHASPSPADVLEIGELTIDLAARQVRVDGEAVDLSHAEFDVLAALARRKPAALSRASLCEAIAGQAAALDHPALDGAISVVKEKLGRAGARIKSVWGVGYRLDG